MSSARAPSAHLPKLFDLPRSALHRVELAVDLACLFRDRGDDVGQHLVALFRSGMLRTAEPTGWCDRTDICEHRLIGSCPPQLVHFVAERVIGGIVDAIEMNEIGPYCEHRKSFYLPAVRQAVARM